MAVLRRKLFIMLALALMLSALWGVPGYAVGPEDYEPAVPQVLEPAHLYAQAAVLLDGVSGRVLLTKNPRERMYPASTTKIMTVMLALESGIALDTPIIVPQQAAQIPQDSTLVPVFPGDQMPFGDLLYGCMLASGNDAANAVAVLVGGTVDAFVERMNRRAAELGCADTHFVNPHGYHDPDHYTTALDLARITQAALENEDFRRIASTERYTFTIRRDGEDITPTRANTNLLLNDESRFYYANCIGVKTGTHSMAGNCFVGASEKDGVRMVAVALNCAEDSQRFTDVIRMMNYGYTFCRGLNATLKGHYHSKQWNVSLLSSITWQRDVDRTDPTDEDMYDKPICYSPTFSSGLTGIVGWRALQFTTSYLYVGERMWSKADPEDILEPYHNVDMKLSYTHNIRKISLGLCLEVCDVLDIQYEHLPRYPMPGRNYKITLSFGI